MLSKLLFLIVFLIPIQKRFAKFLKAFSQSLADPSWDLPAAFEKNVGIFTTDIPLLLLVFICLKNIDWKRLFFEKESKFLTAFLAICLLSILASDHPAYALYYFRWAHLLLPAFLFYYLAASGTEEVRRSVFFGVAAVALFQCGVGLLQYFRQDSVGLKLLGEACLHSKHVPPAGFPTSGGGLWLFDSLFGVKQPLDHIIRAYGTLPHPNILGGFLAMSLIMTYDLFRKNKSRFLVGAAIALQIFVLFLTFSRAALFAWAGGSILWFLLAGLRKERALALGFTVILAAAVSLVLLLPALTARGGVVNYNEVAQDSDQGRIVLQNIAVQMVRDHPFFGVGFYNYFLFAGQYSAAFSFVHNIYLYISAEMGLMGFCFFALFIGCVLWRGWQRRRDADIAAPLAVFCTFLAIGLCDFYLIYHQQGRMMLFLAAGLVCMRSKPEFVPVHNLE